MPKTNQNGFSDIQLEFLDWLACQQQTSVIEIMVVFVANNVHSVPMDTRASSFDQIAAENQHWSYCCEYDHDAYFFEFAQDALADLKEIQSVLVYLDKERLITIISMPYKHSGLNVQWSKEGPVGYIGSDLDQALSLALGSPCTMFTYQPPPFGPFVGLDIECAPSFIPFKKAGYRTVADVNIDIARQMKT